MIDFLTAALPWLCIGVALALWAVNFSRPDEEKKRVSDSYLPEGMCLGLCAALLLRADFLCHGLLIGTAIGMCIPRKSRES